MPMTRRFLVIGILLGAALAQSGGGGTPSPGGMSPRVSPGANSPLKSSSRRALDLPPHAKGFYLATLGIDSLALKSVESGLMISFSYRVVNPEKASVFNDKKVSPYLVDEKTHRALVIPTLEKVGQLRQSGTLEAGKLYWMLFSNKGDFVKPGSRVSVVMGKAHIDGLVVQ